SSDLPGGLGRAVRQAVARRTPPYLVLLRAGFGLPPVLPQARCALTAPFHPYRGLEGASPRRYVFCATFRQVALPGRYPARCPVEFGLSSPRALRGVNRGCSGQRSSGRLRRFIISGLGAGG